MKVLLAVVAALAFSGAVHAEKVLINTDKTGLALQGYDPVAYFTDGKPVKGDAKITASYRGATYRFASAEHKALFEKDPAKYEPQFGGYCGYAASINKISPISPEYWQILDGRLVLQHNNKALTLWKQDVPGNLKKADANWPGLVEKNGKP
jgi:YHS domain-containing protein